MHQRAALVILDGWGLSPISSGNATLIAKTPYIYYLLGKYPKTLLSAASEEVGLPHGEMGNSEVGHLNLGTGRVVIQDLPRINKSIIDGSLYRNENLLLAATRSLKNNKAVHLIGLCSSGGVHSHIDHLFALMDFCKKNRVKNLFIHMITDGRDTSSKTALLDLKKIEQKIKEINLGKIASISGRYYAMDRDKHWDRIEKAYSAMIGKAENIASAPSDIIEKNYQDGITDEFIVPARIDLGGAIKDKDSVIFFNFRADRFRQIWKKLTESSLLKNCFFVSFTSYGFEPTPNAKVAFMAPKTKNYLAEILQNNQFSQTHIAETEKYAHITYFFNGGCEIKHKNEDWVLVPSAKVATYDLRPQMSSSKITQKATLSIGKSDFTVINYANADMVGHTGNLKATVLALEKVDQDLSKLINTYLEKKYIVLITADHGNAEQMIDVKTGEVSKEHTTNPVFLILVDENRQKKSTKPFEDKNLISFASQNPTGLLADVAPTLLEIFNLEKPQEMTGMSLLHQLS